MNNIYYNMFKAYDMRGTVPDLNWKLYFWAGVAFIETIAKPENLPLDIVILRDARYSSEEFYKAFYNGVKFAGGNPVGLGLGSTDMMYAASMFKHTPGAMITASHNPKDDNGLKIVKEVPQMLGMNGGLDKVRDYVLDHIDDDFDESLLSQPVENSELKKQVEDFYAQKLEEIGEISRINTLLATKGKKLKVVVDTGNGMGGYLMPIVANSYKDTVEFIPLYWELDGNFPHHPADPMVKENLVDLQQKVLAEGADLGIAFDGDADRAFFIDQKGNPINGEYLVALLAQYMVKTAVDHPEYNLNPAVVYVISYSRALADTVLESNGAAIVSKQGHTFVKSEMKRYNAIYGGEASGHHYYGLFGYMDSGALTVSLVLKILVDTAKPASDLCTYWERKYFVTGERNYKLPEGLDMAKVKSLVKTTYADAVISELDGITVYYPSWKMTIRGSNTEPLLRINIETKEENQTEQKLTQVLGLIGL